ncbi:MAG TPA: hypothetical protein VIV40_37555 [Kofleriaceae bacterium]
MVLLGGVAGCVGCGDNGNSKPDAFIIHDTSPDSRNCGTAMSGTVDFDSYAQFTNGTEKLSFVAPITGIPTQNNVNFVFEFWSGIETPLSGTFALHDGNQANYSSCAICLLAVETDSQGIVKTYFQSGGSITLTEDPFTNKHMIASVTDLQLEEVDIAQDASSTPVVGGSCVSFGSFTADHDKVPNAWTCTHTEYGAGSACDCKCGTPDPDCLVDSASVVGCTTTEACFNDACVTPPMNDTCADATAAAFMLTVGTPVTGSTAGAHRDYSAGLDSQTCTGYLQPGPDVVYSVNLTMGTAYTITLSGLDPAYDGGVSLVGPGAATLCDAAPITTCVAGADDKFDGQTETFTYTPTADGTYFLIVDGYSAEDGGAFTLNVTM